MAEARMAPIQGVMLRDGRWTAGGPNKLYTINGYTPFSGRVMNAQSVATTIVESGPLKAVIKVSYQFVRPAYAHPSGCAVHNPPSCFYIPPGTGTYTSLITVEASQPSVLIEDETDMELQYFVNVYDPVQPDEGRYRGHDATSVAFGREADGRQYRPWHARPAMDAFREFGDNEPIYSSYGTRGSAGNQTIARMTAWNPWASDTGWYWLLYNRSGGPSSPVVGAFMGSASRALGGARDRAWSVPAAS